MEIEPTVTAKQWFNANLFLQFSLFQKIKDLGGRRKKKPLSTLNGSSDGRSAAPSLAAWGKKKKADFPKNKLKSIQFKSAAPDSRSFAVEHLGEDRLFSFFFYCLLVVKDLLEALGEWLGQPISSRCLLPSTPSSDLFRILIPLLVIVVVFPVFCCCCFSVVQPQESAMWCVSCPPPSHRWLPAWVTWREVRRVCTWLESTVPLLPFIQQQQFVLLLSLWLSDLLIYLNIYIHAY